MKKIALLVCAALVATVSAHADLLKNTTISNSTLSVPTGNGFSSNTFGGSANIGSGKEFDATSNTYTGTVGVHPPTWQNTYKANFSNAVLAVTYSCANATHSGCANSNTQDVYPAFSMTFTDTAFYTIVATADPSFDPAGYTFSISGDVLTIDYSGGPAGTGPAVFKLDFAAATPEPSSLFLLGTGIMAMALFARRRLAA